MRIRLKRYNKTETLRVRSKCSDDFPGHVRQRYQFLGTDNNPSRPAKLLDRRLEFFKVIVTHSERFRKRSHFQRRVVSTSHITQYFPLENFHCLPSNKKRIADDYIDYTPMSLQIIPYGRIGAYLALAVFKRLAIRDLIRAAVFLCIVLVAATLSRRLVKSVNCSLALVISPASRASSKCFNCVLIILLRERLIILLFSFCLTRFLADKECATI